MSSLKKTPSSGIILKKNPAGSKKLKVGINAFSALSHLRAPATDEQIFAALSSKEGRTQF